MAGRVTLLKVVLQALSIYQLSAILALKCVYKELIDKFEKFCGRVCMGNLWERKFLKEAKKWSLVAWDKVCLPKWRGLGLRDTETLHQALGAKLKW